MNLNDSSQATARRDAVELLLKSLEPHIDGTRVDSQEAFDKSHQSLRRVNRLENENVTDVSSLAVLMSAEGMAEIAIRDAEFLVDVRGDKISRLSEVESYLREARNHVDEAEAKLKRGNTSTVIARANAVVEYGEAWEDADSAIEIVEEDVPPEINISSATYDPKDDFIEVSLRGEVTAVRGQDIDKVTLNVNDEEHSELTPVWSASPLARGTFRTTLEIEQLDNVVEVEVSDGEQTDTDSYEFEAGGFGDEIFEFTYEDEDTGVVIDAVGEGLSPGDIQINDVTQSGGPDIRVSPRIFVRDRVGVENATVRIPIDNSVNLSEANLTVIKSDPTTDEGWTSIEPKINEEGSVAVFEVKNFSYIEVIGISGDRIVEEVLLTIERHYPGEQDLGDGSPADFPPDLDTDIDKLEEIEREISWIGFKEIDDAGAISDGDGDGLPDEVENMDSLKMPPSSAEELRGKSLGLNPEAKNSAPSVTGDGDQIPDGAAVDIKWSIFEVGDGNTVVGAVVTDAVSHPKTGEPANPKVIKTGLGLNTVVKPNFDESRDGLDAEGLNVDFLEQGSGILLSEPGNSITEGWLLANEHNLDGFPVPSSKDYKQRVMAVTYLNTSPAVEIDSERLRYRIGLKEEDDSAPQHLKDLKLFIDDGGINTHREPAADSISVGETNSFYLYYEANQALVPGTSQDVPSSLFLEIGEPYFVIDFGSDEIAEQIEGTQDREYKTEPINNYGTVTGDSWRQLANELTDEGFNEFTESMKQAKYVISLVSYTWSSLKKFVRKAFTTVIKIGKKEISGEPYDGGFTIVETEFIIPPDEENTVELPSGDDDHADNFPDGVEEAAITPAGINVDMSANDLSKEAEDVKAGVSFDAELETDPTKIRLEHTGGEPISRSDLWMRVYFKKDGDLVVATSSVGDSGTWGDGDKIVANLNSEISSVESGQKFHVELFYKPSSTLVGTDVVESDFKVDIKDEDVTLIEGALYEPEVMVSNDGSVKGTQTITLGVEGDQKDSTQLTLEPGENKTINSTTDEELSWSTGGVLDEGESEADFDVNVSSEDDFDTTEIIVKRFEKGETPDGFKLSREDVPSQVRPGETIELDIRVTNEANKTLTQTVLGGVGMGDTGFVANEKKTLTLGSGESTVVTFGGIVPEFFGEDILSDDRIRWGVTAVKRDTGGEFVVVTDQISGVIEILETERVCRNPGNMGVSLFDFGGGTDSGTDSVVFQSLTAEEPPVTHEFGVSAFPTAGGADGPVSVLVQTQAGGVVVEGDTTSSGQVSLNVTDSGVKASTTGDWTVTSSSGVSSSDYPVEINTVEMRAVWSNPSIFDSGFVDVNVGGQEICAFTSE
jgi:hypothetical protein